MLGDEGQVAQAKLLKRVGEMKHVHFLSFLDFPADGPVFVEFHRVEDEADENRNTLLFLAFLVGTRDEFVGPVKPREGGADVVDILGRTVLTW